MLPPGNLLQKMPRGGALLSCAVPAACLSLVMALVAGCATSPTAPARPKTSEPALEAARVDIQKDETGFAIVEEVRISGEARAQYDSAIRSLEREDYPQGIELLIKAIEAAPNITALYIDLGVAYSRSGQLDAAEASLKKALQVNPKHPIALNELGLVQRKKGQFAAARLSYEQALALYPDFHFARRNLAILCDIYLADLNCALTHYEAYRQSVPDDKDAAMWIADLSNRIDR